MTEQEMVEMDIPEYRWELKLTPMLSIFHETRPVWWFRLWQRLFLGWTWRSLD